MERLRYYTPSSLRTSQVLRSLHKGVVQRKGNDCKLDPELWFRSSSKPEIDQHPTSFSTGLFEQLLLFTQIEH